MTNRHKKFTENKSANKMKNKTCNKCKKIKTIDQFYKDNNRPDKLNFCCKQCLKKYRFEHKEQLIKSQQKYYLKNKKRIIKRQRAYYKLNREQVKKWNRNFYIKNQIKYRKLMVKRDKNRFNNDINYKIRSLLKTRLYLALKNNQKIGHTIELLGCSIDNLKKHLESKFTKGMSFSNYGKWHIDHIRPCSSFDLSKEEEQAKCFHYTNLQPLWAKENLSKGDKWIN
jgi:hypothetical protein